MTASLRSFRRLLFIVPLVLILPVFGETSQPLPDAPVSRLQFTSQSTPPAAPGQTAPQLDVPAPDPGPPPVHASNTDTYAPSKWYGVVDPGEKVPPLTAHDKMMFWLHESASPVGWVPVAWSAGYGQLVNDDPKYGTDSVAFGERFGAAVLRISSYRFFSDSLLPTMTHEDPRYFRKAYGSVMHRALYAAEQAVVTRNDRGENTANYSVIVGHMAGAGLTATYYPAPSVSTAVVFETFAWAMGGEAGGNAFLEFWPDVRDAVFRRHRRAPVTAR